MLRALLRIALACLLAAPVTLAVAPAPAVAAPSCGPTGEPLSDQVPWPLRRLDPASAWPLSRGEGVVVAVIDSGVSATHPVLAGQVLPGRDFGLPDYDGQCDEYGHGTMVAGIIAGRDDAGVFTGIAPEARILPIRVMRDGRFTRDTSMPGRIAQAIRYAVEQGADVVNLSLDTTPTRELEDAVEFARKNNVVLVAAAGNLSDGQQRDRPAYPAGYPSVLAVAGVDESGNHVGTSVQGPYIDIAGPGLMIYGPAPNGDGYRLEPEGGTSFATAYVSGVVALVRARYPDLSADEVIERVIQTADAPPEGRNNLVGHGVVNPYTAVAAVLGSKPVAPAGVLDAEPTPPDPLAATKAAAAWVAVGGVVIAGVLLGSVPVIRYGRRRGWRPGSP